MRQTKSKNCIANDSIFDLMKLEIGIHFHGNNNIAKIDRSKSELELLKRNGKHQIERKKERESEK